ncbi:MAG: hypothetical protein ACRCYE_10765 [Sarcina sp.]
MKKGLKIFLVPSLIFFGSELIINTIFSLLNTFTVSTQFIDFLNIKIMIFALMIFGYNLLKEFKSKSV